MPNKYNAKCRHHIPKMKFQVKNWAEYDAGLRRRGSLTLWMTDEAVTQWQAAPRLTPGGQRCYSDLAIETSLMLRGVVAWKSAWAKDALPKTDQAARWELRTEFGRPASSIRLSTAMAMAASVCCLGRSRARSPGPMMAL
jgi:hypothetical protein